MATKLNEKAILIKVELKKWGGTKVDKGLSEEIAEKHDVDSKHFSVSKKLTNSKNLKEIKKIDGLIRTDCIYSGAGYRGYCHAWDNQGTYLLPIDAKAKFEKRFAEYRDSRELYVRDFLKEYPDIIEQAKENLGSTFDINDFPTLDDIRDCFTCDVIKSPIPSTDDIRVNLSKDEIDELKSNAKQEHDAKLSEVTGAVVDKVQGVLGHFSEKIKSGETFRDSTIDKVIDLCDVLPSLNVAGDSKIHNAHQELMDIFVGNNIDADTLRKDKDKANEIATKTDAVLDDLGGWLND